MMLIQDVKFCPRCGTVLVTQERMGRVRPVCPECEWIYFPDPKVAAGVFVQLNGKILLTRRANQPKRGLWTLPVGFVDAGEDPVRAAERECLEETGLNVQVAELLEVLWGREHPRGADIIIFYRAEIIAGELTAGDDVDQAAFFPFSDLPPLAFHTTEDIVTRHR